MIPVIQMQVDRGLELSCVSLDKMWWTHTVGMCAAFRSHRLDAHTWNMHRS